MRDFSLSRSLGMSGITGTPACLHCATANVPQRDVGAIVCAESQSVKLIKLIILIEIDYQPRMRLKGFLYSLFGQRLAVSWMEH
jgi:hypothetical protein